MTTSWIKIKTALLKYDVGDIVTFDLLDPKKEIHVFTKSTLFGQLFKQDYLMNLGNGEFWVIKKMSKEYAEMPGIRFNNEIKKLRQIVFDNGRTHKAFDLCGFSHLKWLLSEPIF